MVSNEDVVRTLERIADLLEIRGENIYKVCAYRQAAVQVENLDLEAEVLPTPLALCDLPRVGPRTAALLRHEAGITTIEELEAAAWSGALAGVPRLRERSVERIVAALDTRRAHGAKTRRPRREVEPLARELGATMRAMPQTQRVDIAGSYRRGRDAVGDLDIVVATAQRATILTAFGALPRVERVLLKGDTKCSVEIDSGFQVDCRAVAPDQFGAAMQYFTGSQQHNVRLRARALRLGLLLNEYGVFKVDGGERIAGANEEDVYEALGLRWIEPAEREDHGEIDAAAIGQVDLFGAPATAGRGRVRIDG